MPDVAQPTTLSIPAPITLSSLPARERDRPQGTIFTVISAITLVSNPAR